jgi:hypothetical protein
MRDDRLIGSRTGIHFNQWESAAPPADVAGLCLEQARRRRRNSASGSAIKPPPSYQQPTYDEPPRHIPWQSHRHAQPHYSKRIWESTAESIHFLCIYKRERVGNKKKDLNPKMHKRNAFSTCAMTSVVNEAALFFKKHHCKPEQANKERSIT